MSRNISQLLGCLNDTSVELTETRIASAEKVKELTMQKIERSNRAPAGARRVSRTALIAAALTLVLAISALAVFYGMRARETAEAPTYHLTAVQPGGEMKDYTPIFPDVNLAVSCDVGEKTKDVCFQATWLPQEATVSGTYAGTLEGELWSAAFAANPGPGNMPAITAEDLAPELKKAGLSAEEAASWYTLLQADTPQKVPYSISVYTGAALAGKDLIFFQGTAALVREGTLGDWQLMEIAVDVSQTDSGDPNGNYLLLFHPEDGYLIRVAGHTDFATLERIAESLEVRVTGRDAGLAPGGSQDFLLLDLGRG